MPERIFPNEGIFKIILQPTYTISLQTTQEPTQKTTRKTEERIIEILSQNPQASRANIAEALGGITEDGVKYQLNKLKKQGIIERIGPDKGGYWKIIKQ